MVGPSNGSSLVVPRGDLTVIGNAQKTYSFSDAGHGNVGKDLLCYQGFAQNEATLTFENFSLADGQPVLDVGDVDKLSLRYKGSCSLPSLRIDSLTASPAEDADESAHLTIGKIEKMPGLDNDLTFEDGSVSIAEFLNVTSLTVRDCTLRGEGEDLSGFADAGDISDWAADALSWAVAEGVFNGSDQGLLDPGREITRAECCAILMNWELRAR